MSAQYVEHVFDGVDHNVARCPNHPDQALVLEIEWCGDFQLVCLRYDYRAVQRVPSFNGGQAKWEAPKPTPKGWVPPVRLR